MSAAISGTSLTPDVASLIGLHYMRTPNEDIAGSPQRSRRVELAQFFSDDQTLRDRRKQSTGVEEPRASKRCSSTPLHWKPHFSRMFREDGLETRAPETRCSASNSSKVKSIIARAAAVPNPWPQCSKPSQ